MTDEEVEVVAQELAKAGGTSWYPGRQSGTMLRVVSDRYRDQARLIITAVDRLRSHGLLTGMPSTAVGAGPFSGQPMT